MTKIEWTEKTWNPVAGCTWASAGCDHCYAAVMTRRLAAMGQTDYAGLTTVKHFNGQIRTLPDKLTIPLRRKNPTMWFVNSMSDLFHKDIDCDFICDVFGAMALCPQHTFQVLTKRPERMAELCNRVNIRDLVYDGMERVAEAAGIADFLYDDQWPLPNVWLGTSVENQEQADKRIPHLLQTPAAVRFLSCEPLLGHVQLDFVNDGKNCWVDALSGVWGHGFSTDNRGDSEECIPDGTTGDAVLHWVIVGGESGHGARPMHPDWARSLRDQCAAAGVPFFFKQWGEWAPFHTHDYYPESKPLTCMKLSGETSWVAGDVSDGVLSNYSTNYADSDVAIERVGKKAAGRLLDGREWNEMPEVNRG